MFGDGINFMFVVDLKLLWNVLQVLNIYLLQILEVTRYLFRGIIYSIAMRWNNILEWFEVLLEKVVCHVIQ